jgi:hypothetical protein
VKYARCVKICPFDVLVLFLMPSMQFLKPYVQFLMDTILNLIIIQFLMKKKGDVCYDGACPISIKGRRVLWERVSQLPNCTKNAVNRIFSIECSLCQSTMVLDGTNT